MPEENPLPENATADEIFEAATLIKGDISSLSSYKDEVVLWSQKSISAIIFSSQGNLRTETRSMLDAALKIAINQALEDMLTDFQAAFSTTIKPNVS